MLKYTNIYTIRMFVWNQI